MKVVAGLALLFVNVRMSQSCLGDGPVLFCPDIPPAFSPGFSSLVMGLKDVGEINSTVFLSDSLASVTRLKMETAGVTVIAEGAFSSFLNLKNLILNQNLLAEINPNWFSRPDVLRELRLTGNQIEVVSESTLNGLVNLTRLSLKKNRIRTIDPNSFSSQTILAELDLSENNMTRVSPQAFRYLQSTRIRLGGNPWDCSCGAEDFVDFLKDLQSRSLLDKPTEVTCESPPSLRGQPVWNVSVCGASPPTTPPSVTQSVHPKPTDVLTTSTAGVVTTPPPFTETSVQSKPTDKPMMFSSHSAVPSTQPTSETKTSVPPTDVLTSHTNPTLNAGTIVTTVTWSSLVTETYVHPNPSGLPITASEPMGMTQTCATSRPSSDTNTVCTLVTVIVVLSLLLFAVCFLVALHRRKRNHKTVTPGCPQRDRNELKEEDSSSRSTQAQSPSHSEGRENNHFDSEMGGGRAFTGVRAKSAHAILCTSPSSTHVKDQVTLETETEAPSKNTEKLANESELEEGKEMENLSNTTDLNAKQAADGIRLDENKLSVSVNTDAVPYLSIGTNQNEPSPDKQSSKGQCQSVMGRISTWPSTAAQWQARCRMKEEEEKEEYCVWTLKFPSEVKKVERSSGSDKERKAEENDIEDPLEVNVDHMHLGHFQTSEPNESEAETHTDTNEEEEEDSNGNVRQTVRETRQSLNQIQDQLGHDPELKAAEEDPTCNKSTDQSSTATHQSSTATHQSSEPKPDVSSRKRSTGSKAPSSGGGASPDDETLLSGNEYAFMDLLHEVVQNNGRWTRQRWKETHVNKQRR